jgi:hypothetical protein
MSVETEERAKPTQRIVQAVADSEGVEPVDLDPPLFDVLDGDLLNALVQSNIESTDEPNLEVSFEYLGYDVHLAAGHSITVEKR